jgi:hypothetical protein
MHVTAVTCLTRGMRWFSSLHGGSGLPSRCSWPGGHHRSERMVDDDACGSLHLLLSERAHQASVVVDLAATPHVISSAPWHISRVTVQTAWSIDSPSATCVLAMMSLYESKGNEKGARTAKRPLATAHRPGMRKDVSREPRGRTYAASTVIKGGPQCPPPLAGRNETAGPAGDPESPSTIKTCRPGRCALP